MILRKEFKYVDALEVGSNIPFGAEHGSAGGIADKDAWGAGEDDDGFFGGLGRD